MGEADGARQLIIVEGRRERRRDLAGALGRDGWQVFDVGDVAALRDLPPPRRAAMPVLASVPHDSAAGAMVEALRAVGCAGPVILLGQRDSAAEALRALRAGAADYLVLPVPIAELSARLAQLAAPPEPGEGHGFAGLVAQAPAMRRALDLARRAAGARIAVLLTGASGTGKESVARAIHAASPRAKGPFVAVNCGALPESLVESLLFGHEKGAFTGADRRHAGRFREADGGTIFLDEVGELPPPAQVKLLRVLQEGEVDPVGASAPVQVDVRVISATNRDLAAEIAAGRFREDLFFRLAGVEIALPPLADRPEDILPLARRHAAAIARIEGRPFHGFGPGVEAWLQGRPWPGNVRELQNVIHRAMVLSDGPVLPLSAFELQAPPVRPAGTAVAAGAPATGEARAVRPLSEVEAEAIADALMICRGHISETARRLGIGRSTLYRKMREYGIAQNGTRSAAERQG
ncbi:MAG: sigma-54-dependent Fis family transcriptional regulator [Alphaproteobacteria bacterium]|nr:MAG: sigma-54-dependent Fis family transcriptional regulator [Alphaproteobacteria bacterium]